MPTRQVTDSPTPAELAKQEADATGHVTRVEFRALRQDVHDIKEALMGTLDKPGFLERFRAHEAHIKLASRAAWLAVIGTCGMIGKLAWDKLTGAGH